MKTIHAMALAVILVLTGGCGTAGGSDRATLREGGARVVTGEDLHDVEGDLLTQLLRRVPGMRVNRGTDGCPRVVLRNAASMISPANPQVYVDGARTLDTCILESLRARDVERVEVYASGTTRRPGYAQHPHGLILVFMRLATPPPLPGR
jgi:hypothetical protein